MSAWPEHWSQRAFGDLNQFTSALIDPSRFPEELFELYSVPSFGRSGPEYVNGAAIGSNKQLVESQDVLVCKINPRINRVWVVGPRTSCRQIASSEWIVFRCPAISATFARHYFASSDFRELMCADVTGVGGSLTRAQPKRVGQLTVPVAPPQEQQRIANKLDALLARIDACRQRLDRVRALVQRFRQSVLHAATTGRLTAEWHEAHREADLKSVRLGDVAHDFGYGSAAKSSPQGRVPVLRMGNIQGGKLDWTDLVYTSDETEAARYALEPGDVVFNRTNSPELVGKAAVYRGERPAIFAGYLIRVRCGADLLPEYLNHCLGSPAGRDYCRRVKSDGVSQSNINAKKLADFVFLLPSVEEQREIVRRCDLLLDAASAIESRCLAANRTAARGQQATLAKAFRGELVSQDPTDEPAESLLARLRQDDANAAPPPSRRRGRPPAA